MNLRHRSQATAISRVQIRWVKQGFVDGPRGVRHSSWSAGVRAFLLLVVTLAAFFGMAGCSTNGAKNASLQTPLISVGIAQAPPSSMLVGNSAPVAATVANDLADAGVDWVAICGSAPNCGFFTPPHTASGGTTVFTAPLAVPAKTTVAVTALSATDHSKAFSGNVTIISTVTSVMITQPPPNSAPAGTAISFTASVAGDPSNEGVDWKATCSTIIGSVDCTPGGFHSASGSPIFFSVPAVAQVPTIVGGTVTITAFATADHGFSAMASFTVTDPITISLTQVPPSTMLVNATATVLATLSNDTTNSGIDWSVSCFNTPCGSVSPSHTASGAPATFIAPPTVPAPTPPNPVVTIKATASATNTNALFAVFATANVTIVAPISINITQGPLNNTVVQNHNASLVAVVGNDAANAGVDWTVACGSAGNCGTFSPAHTASGAATTFTAPSAIPPGGSVSITAASTTDPTKTATDTVTVTLSPPPNSLLSGKFVILLTATNSANHSYTIGGVITGDGNGTITDGTFDLVDNSGNALGSVHPVSPSTYSIQSDGRGQIHLQPNPSALNVPFGENGTGALDLSVVFVTPEHALLSEIDSFGNGSGTLDLQNIQGFTGLNGVYSLRLSGVPRPAEPYFVASAVTIPSTSSYSYITDQSNNGAITSVPFTTVLHGFASGGLDFNGELSLSSVDVGLPTKFSLNLWAIDASHFIVTDWRDPGATSGYFTAQPATPSVSGTYAFTESGASTTSAQSQVAGGIFTCGSTGTLDVIPLGGTVTTNQAITAVCTTPTSGRALITLSGTGSAGISTFAAYPTLDKGLDLIELDGGSAGGSGSSGTGVAIQQTLSAPISASALSGTYASDFLASTTLGSENFAAKIVSDGVSTLSGVVDVNSFNTTATPPTGTPSPGATLSGSFTTGPNGRFPLALTITPAVGQPTPSPATINAACYMVDANTCLVLGLDNTAPGTGILLLQRTGL